MILLQPNSISWINFQSSNFVQSTWKVFLSVIYCLHCSKLRVFEICSDSHYRFQQVFILMYITTVKRTREIWHVWCGRLGGYLERKIESDSTNFTKFHTLKRSKTQWKITRILGGRFSHFPNEIYTFFSSPISMWVIDWEFFRFISFSLSSYYFGCVRCFLLLQSSNQRGGKIFAYPDMKENCLFFSLCSHSFFSHWLHH